MPRGVYDRDKVIMHSAKQRESANKLAKALKASIELEETKSFNHSPESMHSITLEYLRTLRTECAHRLAHFDEIIHMLEQERG